MGSQLEAYGAYERYTTVRQFWSAIAARISETWQNHGVLVGTVVVLYAIFIAALESLLQGTATTDLYASATDVSLCSVAHAWCAEMGECCKKLFAGPELKLLLQ